MFVGLGLFPLGAVDAKICFLLGEIYRHIFLLDRNKEPQIFPKGRKKLPDAGLQINVRVFPPLFPLAFFKLNNYTGYFYPEEGPQFFFPTSLKFRSYKYIHLSLACAPGH